MTLKQKKLKELELTRAYQDFEKDLTARAFYKTHNKTTSRDIVQDTFVKTWSYLIKGGKIEIMKSFLYHVLNGLIIDEYRKRKNVSLDILLEKGFEPSFKDPQERIYNILDGKTVLVLSKYLPVKYKKLIQMRFVQDLSLKEISLITGKSKNTIAVQIHRGLTKLKSIYHNGGHKI